MVTLAAPVEAQRARPKPKRPVTAHELGRLQRAEDARAAIREQKRRSDGMRAYIHLLGRSEKVSDLVADQRLNGFVAARQASRMLASGRLEERPSSVYKATPARPPRFLQQTKPRLYPMLLSRLTPPLGTSENIINGPDLLPRIAIFDALPKGPNGYRAVFDEPLTAASSDQVRHGRAILSRSNATLLPVEATGTVIAAMKRRPEPVLIFVGHNEGGRIRTPGGQEVSVREISNGCAKLRKLCVFLTCRSANFVQQGDIGVKIDLSLVQAAKVAERLTRMMSTEPLRRAAPTPGSRQGAMVLADPHGTLERLTRQVNADARPTFLGIRRDGYFILVAIIISSVANDD